MWTSIRQKFNNISDFQYLVPDGAGTAEAAGAATFPFGAAFPATFPVGAAFPAFFLAAFAAVATFPFGAAGTAMIICKFF